LLGKVETLQCTSTLSQLTSSEADVRFRYIQVYFTPPPRQIRGFGSCAIEI